MVYVLSLINWYCEFESHSRNLNSRVVQPDKTIVLETKNVGSNPALTALCGFCIDGNCASAWKAEGDGTTPSGHTFAGMKGIGIPDILKICRLQVRIQLSAPFEL
jgi:hypothetical protein